MHDLLSEIRVGLRGLGAHPGLAAVAVLCLALGIGANSALFSVVDAVLWRPFPLADDGRLVLVWDTFQSPGEGLADYPASAFSFLHWREKATAFAGLAAMQPGAFILTGEGEPERLQGALVSADFFALLGIEPARGRGFAPEEDRPGAARVAVVGHGLWQRRFGSDPALVGKTLTLSGESHTVIGVGPPGFRFPEQAELWTALVLDPGDLPPWHDLYVLGRLAEGTTLAAAQAGLSGLAQRLAEERPDSHRGWGVRVVSLRRQLVGEVQTDLLHLFGAVLCVLAIACGNVSNLLLSHGARRASEFGLRAVLGASRGRLARQALIESTLLALFGAAAGLLLAWAGLRAVVAASPLEIPSFQAVRLDHRVLAFTLAIALASGAVAGLIPALRAARGDLATVVKAGGWGSLGGRAGALKGALVIAEVGLALVLVNGATLLSESLGRLRAVEPGFSARGVLTLRLGLPTSKYPLPEQRAAFFAEALERLAGLPGAEAVALTTTLPLSRENVSGRFTIEGREAAGEEGPMANSRMVSPGYFRTLAIPVLAGRDFDRGDGAQSPGVVIVSQELARRFWPQEDPVGKRLKRGGPASDRPWLTVVGVVGDVHDAALDAPAESTLYMPYAQNSWGTASLAVRTRSDPLALARPVQQVIRAIDPDQPVWDVALLDRLVAGSVSRPRFNALLFGLFAALALTLAAGGVYGVMAYAVGQRTREMGLRMALGARRQALLRLVLRQGLALALVGVALGLLGSRSLTRLLVGSLYGVRPGDPASLLLAVGLLLGTALLAILAPAVRATRVDPVDALRRE